MLQIFEDFDLLDDDEEEVCQSGPAQQRGRATLGPGSSDDGTQRTLRELLATSQQMALIAQQALAVGRSQLASEEAVVKALQSIDKRMQALEKAAQTRAGGSGSSSSDYEEVSTVARQL